MAYHCTPPTPSSQSACRVVRGETDQIPQAVAHMLGRAVLIWGGMRLFGQPASAGSAVAGAAGVSFFLILWMGHHERRRRRLAGAGQGHAQPGSEQEQPAYGAQGGLQYPHRR